MAWFGSANTDAHDKKRKDLLAPAPVAPISLLGDTVPPDTTLARSNATAEALAAAQRARKKAAGSLLTGKPVARATTATAKLAPKSLIGGY